MRFVIRGKARPLRYPPLGPRGRELASHIPQGVEWKQLNYGQGEGQVEINGCEWGIYLIDCYGLAVHLHAGECPAAEAFDLVQGIATITFGNQPFEIVVQGSAES